MRYRLIAVPAADKDRANTDAVAFAGSGGSRTFEQAFSNDGGTTLTHYVCSTAIPDDAVDAAIMAKIASAYPGALVVEWDMEDDPDGAQNALASLGLVRFP